MIINFSYYNDTKQFDDKYGYCLHEGEIIRLGKVIFKVIQIKIIEDEERLKIKKKGIISNSELHSMNNSNISNIKSNNKPNSKLKSDLCKLIEMMIADGAKPSLVNECYK